MAKGMLALTPEQEEQLRLEDSYRWAQLTPTQQLGQRMRQSQQGVERGVVQTLGGLTGTDVRSQGEKNRDAAEQVKQTVMQSGIDPQDIDKYYPMLIRAYGQAGLVDEARTAAEEYMQIKSTRERTDAYKASVQPKPPAGKDALIAKRDKLVENRIAATDPQEQGQLDRAIAGLDESINKYYSPPKEQQKAEWKHVVIPAQEGSPARLVTYDERAGTVNDPLSIGGGKAPGAATRKAQAASDGAKAIYSNAIASLQKQYDAIVELYNNKGLDAISGAMGEWVGAKDAGGSPTIIGSLAAKAAGPEARAAIAKYEQVAGGAFLSGLAQLKQASKTGATGLGAVSEREGDKVQAEAAALRRVQDGPALRAQLKQYADYIADYAGRLAQAADGDGIPPIQFRTGGFTVPRGARAAQPARPAAAAQPAPTGDRVRVVSPDGTTGTIPRSQLDEAKAAGFTEAK